ncbi:hypothetical protein [Streptomyces sp. NPDC021622]|uniref:hypothetical protein n=1 Tax=Streptomyces sp. NPDC021622 TaxID=3155013 RepID=UPI0033F46EA0
MSALPGDSGGGIWEEWLQLVAQFVACLDEGVEDRVEMFPGGMIPALLGFGQLPGGVSMQRLASSTIVQTAAAAGCPAEVEVVQGRIHLARDIAAGRS